MADLSIDFAGIKSPNPFWLASAPPANTGDQVMRAFDLGWGGAVWKTLGDPIVDTSSRFGSLDVNGMVLRLTLKLTNTDAGATGLLVSIDQGGAEIPLTLIVQTGAHLKFTVLAFVSCGIGMFLVLAGVKLFELPQGTAGGILAGSQTMSAAIGSAEQAVTQGVVKLKEGTTPDQVTAMIALSYGITYIWGTVGIILICKYLPRWWGIDAKVSAKEYEKEHVLDDDLVIEMELE